MNQVPTAAEISIKLIKQLNLSKTKTRALLPAICITKLISQLNLQAAFLR